MSIRVLIVDDSAFVRDVLREVLSRYDDIIIIGEARDGRQACELLPTLQPDVITMDILMPMLGGIESIEKIMKIMPTPVLVVADSACSDQLQRDALNAGAVGSFRKPSRGFDEATGNGFARAIRKAAQAQPRRVKTVTRPIQTKDLGTIRVLGIVSSTGGPQTLAMFLAALGPPPLGIAIYIVQHTSAGFTQGLVDWLSALTNLPLRIAEEGHLIETGEVIIAADDRHMEVLATGHIHLSDAPPIRTLRPCGDILLTSLAQSYGRNSAGLICTGMGKDGSEGLLTIESAGGTCLVQSPETAVVDSMPRSASKKVKSRLEVNLHDLAIAMRGLR